MCGIGAIIAPRTSASSTDGWRMVEQLRHRGPDGSGVVALGADGLDVEYAPGTPTHGGVVLAHTRLAIIDLSDVALQPMTNERRTVWLVFNGEIYNFRLLRTQLEKRGHRFASNSDSEVLVHGWEEWQDGLLERIEGMFSFCIHDLERQRTVLARDRLGIKPLYYARRGDGAFVAGSEIKALLAAGVDAQLDPAGIDRFLTWLWVPDPDTAFAGIKKLPPGCALDIDAAGCGHVRHYWDFVWQPDGASFDAHACDLREAVVEAVDRQLMSDVPLGAFFSGGLDSTAVVEVMRRRVAPDYPICHTIGFSERDLAHDVIGDDLAFARAYADGGTIAYREHMLVPDLAEALPRVVWHLEEPVADPAALSAYFIAQSARDELTVMLSGVGGDELFGGYPRYAAASIARRYRRLPVALRHLVRRAAFRLPASGAGRLTTIGRNAQKLLAGADLPFPDDYLSLLTYFDADMRSRLLTPEFRAAVGEDRAADAHRRHLLAVEGRPWLDQAMYLDLKTFLPSLNLTYMDKMSMAHSLEVRVPLLDERVLEVVARIAPHERLKRLNGKPLFRRAMAGIVPDEILRRGKVGFSAPVRGWLAHELSPMVDELLSPDVVRERGLLRLDAVEALITDFRHGRRDNALQIWQLLTLELWQRAFVDQSLRPAVTAGAA
jgi:asparagine synthase (glutamine-hydrolysing)